MADPEKTAKDQVKEAAWQYTAWGLVLTVVFFGGVFLGYQLWGAGEMGQPALEARVAKLDDDLNRIKNEREQCQKTLAVVEARQGDLQKEMTRLKSGQ